MSAKQKQTYAKPRGEDQNSTACVLQSPVSLSIPHSYVKGRKRKRVFTPHSVIGFVNSEIPHRNRSSSSALNLAPLSPHVSAARAAAQLCFLTSRLSSPHPRLFNKTFIFQGQNSFLKAVHGFLHLCRAWRFNCAVLCLEAQLCLTLCDPNGLVAHQAPLSMRFSRQGNWSGLHFLLQGIFPPQGLKPGLLHCRWILYKLSYQGSPRG